MKHTKHISKVKVVKAEVLLDKIACAVIPTKGKCESGCPDE